MNPQEPVTNTFILGLRSRVESQGEYTNDSIDFRDIQTAYAFILVEYGRSLSFWNVRELFVLAILLSCKGPQTF
jgi:hypothetical protein